MTCFKCFKMFIGIDSLIKHIRLLHMFEQNFVCKQENCHRTFPLLNGLKKHLVKNHLKYEKSEQLNEIENEDNKIEKSSSSCSLEYQNFTQNSVIEKSNIFQTVQNAIVCFISKMYSKSSLPRNIVQIVIEDVKELFNYIISSIEAILHEKNEMVNEYNEVRDLFKEIKNIFELLGTEHKRLKFLEDNKCYIKPNALSVGEKPILKKINKSSEANMVIQKAEGQIIELNKVLKQFLELPNVFDNIVSYMQNEESLCDENIRTTILQGTLWKEVKLKFPNKIIIPLYLFCDDFEPNNPLGTKSGIYKVNAVYVSVASVPIQYASLLENIFLTQLCFSADRVHYGNKNIFYKIIQELKHLETEGITIQISSKENVQVYFTLLLILGDNLGLNSMLGFNESFQSHYFCRFCKTHKDETKYQVKENEENLRNIENYNNDCLSSSFGIKEVCIWHELPNFHVTNNLSCDLMHDVLEGVLRYDMAHIIFSLITKKYFSLRQLNERIKYFKFAESDTGNPIPLINFQHLKKRYIIMSASEMLALTTYFCILVGDLIPLHEPVWNFYILLYKMLDILLSKTVSNSSIFYLKSIIEEHHKMYCNLFKETLKPKFHFLLHYPRIMTKVGPIRHIWCMRYEGFHKQLKSTAKIVTSRVNLLRTLCIKQQLVFSYRILSKKGFCNTIVTGQFIDSLRDIKEIKLISLIKTSTYILSEKASVFVSVKIDNIKYSLGSILQINDTEFDCFLNFGFLQYIILDNESVIFVMSQIETVSFQDHLQAYEIVINQDAQWFLQKWEYLPNKFPYNVHMMGNGNNYIVPLQ